LDWAHAFDLNDDGQYDDVLDPGAILPTPVDLAIDFGSNLEFRLTGVFTGTGSYSYDPDFGTNKTVTIDNVILTFGDVRIAGTAEFALVKRTVSVDENGTAAGGVASGASLMSVALTVSGLGVHVEDVAHLNVSGQLALASVTPAAQTVARYTAFKMGDVVVSGDVNLGIGELTAEIVVKSLDMNTAAVGFARLDWTHAFDLDGDGQYGDVLDPGAELPTPVDLAIDFASSLEFRLTGSFSGTGDYLAVDDDFDAATAAKNYHNVILTLGDVRLTGTAEFALVKRTVSVDENGTVANGVANGASLLSVALTVSGLGVHVGNVAHLSVSGQLALASVTLSGQTVARYTAFKMGDVSVSGDVNLGIGELTAEIVVKSLDMNSAPVGQTRLDWAHAFDLDGDGQYGDVLDPGAELPTPVDLSIDFTSSLEFRLTGSFSGTGEYIYDPDFDADTDNDVTIDNVILTFGDVRIAGTAEFALVKRTVSVDENGTAALGVANGASLMTMALTVNGL
ncbi:MAG TPA: hypothetical protein VFE69_10075, partial [Ilumatobacteraceae bacterium]|nr:hypothetical protein [Ilumatobacteraceae bacterium]